MTKAPATDTKKRVRDRLVKKHGSLYHAAVAGDMREATLRRWLYESPTRMDNDTERGFQKIGVKRSELLDQ